jgi:hypothetical protein
MPFGRCRSRRPGQWIRNAKHSMMRREADGGAVITGEARHSQVRPFARARVDTDTRRVRTREVRILGTTRPGTNTGTFDTSPDRRGWSHLRLVCSSTRVATRRTTAATGERAWAFPIGRSGRNEGLS